MKQGFLFSCLFCLCVSFFSCIKPGANNEPEEGLIYFRWIQNLSHPTCAGCDYWCNLRSGNFNDSNDAVPDYASEDTYYGPCQPATYTAQFNFDQNNSGTGLISFTYKLERPEPGYIRYYTKNLREYRPNLNRCISVATEPGSLTYTDVKQ